MFELNSCWQTSDFQTKMWRIQSKMSHNSIRNIDTLLSRPDISASVHVSINWV